MKKFIALAMAFCMLFAFAACTQTGTEEPGEMKALNTDGKMVIGTTATTEPFTYAGEDGVATGFAIDVAKAVAADMGATAEVVTMASIDELVAALNNNEIDVIADVMESTDETKALARLTSSYYEEGEEDAKISYVFALQRGKDLLQDAVNASLSAVRGIKDEATGLTQYDEIFANYWPAEETAE